VDEGVKKTYIPGDSSRDLVTAKFGGHLTIPKRSPAARHPKITANLLLPQQKLGGGFKYVLCSPLFGEDSQFDYIYMIFFKGLKPPNRKNLQHRAGHHRNPLHLLNACFWGGMEILSLKLFSEDFFACFYNKGGNDSILPAIGQHRICMIYIPGI